MTFVCLGVVSDPRDGASKLSGRPMTDCHARGEPDQDRPTSANGRRVRGTFAFVPNATRGELAIADMETGRLLDLGPASAGYGLLPIGGAPESISATQDGCWVATANRTSCDFTMMDPSRLVLLAETFDRDTLVPITGAGEGAHRIAVQTGTTHRRLYTAAGEIAFLPSEGGGETCGERPPRAVATFPGCDMVAVLDLSFETSTATIRSAYHVRAGRLEAAGDEPVCPVDCAVANSGQGEGETPSVEGQSPDGGAIDGGGSIDGGPSANDGRLRLQALAVEPGGARIHVAGLHDTAIVSFDVVGGQLGNPSRFELVEEPAGVTRLRLGVDPYATTTLADATVVQGRFLDDNHKFIYAIANDDSIRVVELTGPTPVECDVNVLPIETAGRPCVPVGSARRRALARGPGLAVPRFSYADQAPPVPRDIAFANLVATDTDTNFNALTGSFGFLLASNGQVYAVDTATHSFREARQVGAKSWPPLLLSIAPQRAVIVSDQAFASTPSFGPAAGPMIKSSTGNNAAEGWFGFPDPTGMISRSWDVTWEAALPQASRESGLVSSAGTGVSSAGMLTDSGADFCSSGVRPGDVLMFAGCSTDADCQPDNLVSCQVMVSGARGLCLPKDNAAKDELARRCARFMGSRLRYEIASVGPTGLALNLKLDEVPKTTLNPCQTNDDCRPDVEHGLLTGDSPDGGATKAFECVETRPQERRCVERCVQDSDCRPGNVCESVPGVSSSAGKLCVQAPPLDAGCFPQPMTRYTVRAGNSYVVTASSMPRVRDRRASKDGRSCEIVDTGHPQIVNRIPLSAPRCPESFFQPNKEAKDLSAFSLPPGHNPCLYTEPGTPHPTVLAFFENPQLRFVLTNLDDYAGDLLSIHFEFQDGYQPLTVSITSYEILLTMPIRILTGPTMTPESPVRRDRDLRITYPYIYVIDQGRTALTPSSRGQVLRINPRAGGSEIPTFDTATSGSTPFQLQ